MAAVRIPYRQPTAPGSSRLKALVPIQAAVLRRFADAATYGATWRTHRVAHCVYDYDTSALPLEQQNPVGVDQTVRCYWTVSPRARFVVVTARCQGAVAVGGVVPTYAAPSLSVSLEETDGTPIDPGVTWGAGALAASYDVAVDELGAEVVAPLQRVFTPLRSQATPMAPTPPRMLNLGEHQGEFIAAKFVTTDARVVSVDIWEYVPATAPQLFTPEAP